MTADVDLISALWNAASGEDFEKAVNAAVEGALVVARARKQHPPNTNACHPDLLAAIVGDSATKTPGYIPSGQSAIDWLKAACRNGPDAGIHHAVLFKDKA